MKRLALIAVCFACSPSTEVAPSDPAAVDAQAIGKSRDVMVYLAAEADLTVGSAVKEERGSILYRRLAAHAEATQAPIVQLLLGKRYQSFHIVNAILVHDASDELIAVLRARKDVARVVEDRAVRLLLPPKSAEEPSLLAGVEKSLIATGADKVWSQLQVKGAGVVVAGQDTGVDWTHPALKAKYRGWDGTMADHRYNWHDSIHGSGNGNPCGYDSAEPCDDDQHGTHTMGTMVGDDGAGNQVGMAPDAKWIACRNMDEGRGKPSTYIECFEWFLAPYPKGGDPKTDGDPTKAPDVVNNSWGCDGSEGCKGDEIVPAIRALKAAGVVIVASAGNEGPSCSTIGSQPATDSADTITVGAYDYRNDKIASFSSRGPSTLDGQVGPQVAAPGVGIRSCVPGGGYAGGWDGTSMAGPHVVGEVALILSAVPALRGKPDDVAAIVRGACKAKTSTQTCGGVSGSAVPNNVWGYGIIDALAATQHALGQ